MEATAIGSFRVKITGGTLVHRASDRSISIDESTRLVGRGDSCHLRLDDRLVSTAHCELVATDRGVLIRDLASTNGTRINDVLLGSGQHAILRRLSKIRLGETELELTPATGTEREIVGKFGASETRSAKMRFVLDRLHRVASLSASVHLTGEIGTGKTFFARAIHNQSARASKPFMVIDCAAIPPTLAEAELFGYEKGAYTGATSAKESPFVEADGGTVFLDEIGDLSLDVQARLLRVVDEQEVKAVGQNRYRKVDVRIISATKHNLAARVNGGQFRDDLYSRLTAAHIEIPPLRERREDIETLVPQLLADFGHPELFADIPSEKMAWLRERPWTGNVRQLRHVVRNLVDLARSGSSDVAAAVDLAYGLGPAERATEDPRAAAPNAPGASTTAADRGASPSIFDLLTTEGRTLAAVRAQAERVLLERLFRETGGDLTELAQITDASRNHVSDLLEKHGFRKRQSRGKAQ